MKAEIEIKLDGARASLIVNGTDISNKVRKYTLTHEAGNLAILTVEMNAINVSVAGGVISEVPEPWKDFYVPREPDVPFE